MTVREKTSLLLVAVGVAAFIVAAVGYFDWRAGVLVFGVAGVVLGVVLGVDAPTTAGSPADEFEPPEWDGELREAPAGPGPDPVQYDVPDVGGFRR